MANASNIQDILEAFELFSDWDERYQYLVELGERLAPMAPELKTDATRVKPCMSVVHVAAWPDPDKPGTLRFAGDCDTAIIKGVVALLVGLFDGKSAKEILDLDIDALFAGLKLAEHLSPNRHVGIYAIVDQMKEQALAAESR